MAALIMALAGGANLTHMGRFALTAFLHTIGLSVTQIVEVYQRSPDFDIEKTLYQVEHISGRSGTEYTPPSCATMETNGLCVHRDALCERIGRPARVLSEEEGKSAARQSAYADLLVDHVPRAAHQNEEDHDGEQVGRPRGQDERQADNQHDHDEQGDDPDHEVQETRIHCLCTITLRR